MAYQMLLGRLAIHAQHSVQFIGWIHFRVRIRWNWRSISSDLIIESGIGCNSFAQLGATLFHRCCIFGRCWGFRIFDHLTLIWAWEKRLSWDDDKKNQFTFVNNFLPWRELVWFKLWRRLCFGTSTQLASRSEVVLRLLPIRPPFETGSFSMFSLLSIDDNGGLLCCTCGCCATSSCIAWCSCWDCCNWSTMLKKNKIIRI